MQGKRTMSNINKIARLLEEQDDLGSMLNMGGGPDINISDIAKKITNLQDIEQPRKLSIDAKYELDKKDERMPRSEQGSSLTALTAIRAVKELIKLLGSIGASLDEWEIKWTLDGFQIVNIQISLRDPDTKTNILDSIKDAYPGARHDFDKNPNVYTFLSVHSDLGKAIRNNLGLQYEAFDDGRGNVGIVIKNPPVDLPVEEEEEDITPEDVPGGPGSEFGAEEEGASDVFELGAEEGPEEGIGIEGPSEDLMGGGPEGSEEDEMFTDEEEMAPERPEPRRRPRPRPPVR